MKFAFFDDFEMGVVVGDDVCPLAPAIDLGSGTPQEKLNSVIERFETLRPAIEAVAAESGPRVQINRVRLRPPVPRPCQIVCAFRNYVDNRPRSEIDFFLKSPLAVVGNRDSIELPPIDARVFHHEAELAVVIGRRGHHVARADASNFVFGYTGLIDVSARDVGISYYRRKSYRTFAPMGPVLVTADEIADPQNVPVKLWVNGQLRQDFSTSDMDRPIDVLIENASEVTGFEVGDVIATGTHHVGIGPLQDGDEVDMEIEGIGRLGVRVSDTLKRRWNEEGELQP